MYGFVRLIYLGWIIFGIWWLVWLGLAIATKAKTITWFLALAAVVWFGVHNLLIYYTPFAIYLSWFLLPLFFLPSMLRVVTEYERGVLFRFGRQIGVLQPGINLVFPMGIDFVKIVDLRTFTIDVPKQEVITRDNVNIFVDAVVYFNVLDPVLATVKVADYVRSTSLLGQTILRSVLGQHELDEILKICRVLDETKLAKYLEIYDKRILYKKAGYFMERYQQSLGITNDFLSHIEKKTGNTRSYLDEKAKNGNGILIKRWGLIVPKTLEVKDDIFV